MLSILLQIEHLVSYLEKVSEAAPDLPMFYYHIPIMTGVNCESAVACIWLLSNVSCDLHGLVVGWPGQQSLSC